MEHVEIQASDLTGAGWRPSIKPMREMWVEPVKPYGFVEILERLPEEPEEHGAKRFAIMCLGADAFAAFDALRSRMSIPLWCVVLQDHGFGGNYDKFGDGGHLSTLVDRMPTKPEFLIVGENTAPWKGYVPVPGVEPEYVGSPGHYRHLFERVSR